MKSPSSLLLVLVLMSTCFTGCAVINSHSETKSHGTAITDATLQQVEVGSTTEAWLVATLGAPASATEVDAETRLLKYSSSQITRIKSHLLLVLDTSSRKEVKQTVFFEFKDGVLSRHWMEKTKNT